MSDDYEWNDRLRLVADEFDERAERKDDWPPPLDLPALARRDPSPPRWIVDGWLPCGYATLLAGHGGAGKSSVALMVAICIAAGHPWYGIEVERRRVLYLSCEDREQVLHWRLTRICEHLGIELASLAGWLHVVDLVGHDAVLWERGFSGKTDTIGYARLHDRVVEYGSDVLVADGTADTFGGSEIARTEVKRYVNSLVALVSDIGAVLLVAHVNKPTASGTGTTEGYSGSTSWHNSVRARWYLRQEMIDEDGRQEPTGDLLLELAKSNLGLADQAIRVSWDDSAHVFSGQVITPPGVGDRWRRDRRERDAIVAAMRAACVAEIPIPAATMGQRTAYNVLLVQPDFPDSLRGGKPEKRRFWRHLEELRRMHAIRTGTIRRANRHLTEVIELADGETEGSASAPNA